MNKQHNMYYEEAEVKEYYRKDSKGNKKPYYQIGIKKKSKFNEAKTIALVDIDDIQQIEEYSTTDGLKELEVKLKEATVENDSLNKKLLQLKEGNETLEATVNELKDKVAELQQELLQVKEEHDIEVKDLTSKLLHEKDLTKTLLVVRSDIMERGLIGRIRNIEPDSSKKLKELKELPEVNVSKE
jgi:predicted RNase H-like nuclease (RuvC/YqgF family)